VLLAYPAIETGANWLHDSLVRILVAVHNALQACEEPSPWLESVPSQYRERLESRPSLNARIAGYVAASRTLSDSEHEQALSALSDQNQIERLLANETECERMHSLPGAIREPLGELCDVAFRLLADLEIRDAHEEFLITKRGQAMCPFCGCEYFEPSGVRADLDHYLARTVYPYASANLKNLVPMGKYCNQGFKGKVDLLYDGSRRCTAYFPFGTDVATIDLDQSDPLGEDRRPNWVVRLVPGDGRTETWDRVFRIKDRYTAILRRDYDTFLSEFHGYCCLRAEPPDSKAELIHSLEVYVELQGEYGLSDRAFLKAAVFKMLLKHCREGNDDLVELLLAVTPALR
jgi:hypothetical protein